MEELKIEIFENYDAFLGRKDKSINGVSKSFLESNNITIEQLQLTGCEGCWNCMNCDDCKDCKNCEGDRQVC